MCRSLHFYRMSPKLVRDRPPSRDPKKQAIRMSVWAQRNVIELLTTNARRCLSPLENIQIAPVYKKVDKLSRLNYSSLFSNCLTCVPDVSVSACEKFGLISYNVNLALAHMAQAKCMIISADNAYSPQNILTCSKWRKYFSPQHINICITISACIANGVYNRRNLKIFKFKCLLNQQRYIHCHRLKTFWEPLW